MKTIPLTILVHDGPIARAYMEALACNGLSPSHIISLVSSKNLATGKSVAKWLPHILKLKIAEKSHNHSMFYWPRFLRISSPKICNQLTNIIGKELNFDSSFFDGLLGNKPLNFFCENVDRVLFDTLDDKGLFNLLKKITPNTILYTGGGIVPKSLLDVKGLRFLHIHPGFLPDVRGADGLLWSYLIRKRPGASCFYMSSGLDTGDIIISRDLPRISFPIKSTERPSDQILYRLLFIYFDPAIRARILIEALSKGDDPFALPSNPQQKAKGISYHFMHSALKKKALEQLFPHSESPDIQ